MNPRRFLPTLLIFFGGAIAGAQDHASIHLANGTVMDAEIVNVGDRSLSFRTGQSTLAVELSYDQIDAVVWPEPGDWVLARQAFDQGRHEEAAALFAKMAAAKADPRFGYPAPGNYATLAQRRLVECLRRRGDAAGVAKQIGAIETDRLPASERTLPPALHAWAALGEGKWERVIEIAAGADGVPPASAQGVELAYLSGMALRNSGRPAEALVAFGHAYGLGVGGDEKRSRAAMEEALRTLEGDDNETRVRERRALAHLYAALFGRGSLWEGAPAGALAALSEPVEIGEAALGQSGRVGKQGDISGQSSGLGSAEQVTADHMKKVKVEAGKDDGTNPKEKPEPE